MMLVIDKTRLAIEKGQTPFGACIVKNGEVISIHVAAWGIYDVTSHAEIETIRAACTQLKTRDLSGCVLYSTCAPCPMCFSACYFAGISRIVYGVSLEDSERVGFDNPTISPEKMKQLSDSEIDILGGFLWDENWELFRLWVDRGQ